MGDSRIIVRHIDSRCIRRSVRGSIKQIIKPKILVASVGGYCESVVATWQFVDTTKAPVVFCVWKWSCGWDFRFVDGASPEWTGNAARFVLNVSRAIHIDSCSYKAIGVRSHYTILKFTRKGE